MDSITKFIRHGDRNLREIGTLGLTDIPKDLTGSKHGVIGLGETTGHKHQLRGQTLVYDLEKPQTFKTADGRNITVDQFVEVKQQASLVHEEHKELEIPMGKYAVVPEREIDILEQKIRRTAD